MASATTAAAAAEPAAGSAAEPALLTQFLKQRAKLAEMKNLVGVPETAHPKAARKLASMQAQVDAAEQQLRAAGVDVDGALQSESILQRIDQWHGALKGEFDQAWDAHLTATGRANLIVSAAEQASPVAEQAKRGKRIELSPLDLAKDKVERLKFKLEREEFRVQWLTQREVDLRAQHEQLRKPAPPANAPAA